MPKESPRECRNKISDVAGGSTYRSFWIHLTRKERFLALLLQFERSREGEVHGISNQGDIGFYAKIAAHDGAGGLEANRVFFVERVHAGADEMDREGFGVAHAVQGEGAGNLRAVRAAPGHLRGNEGRGGIFGSVEPLGAVELASERGAGGGNRIDRHSDVELRGRGLCRVELQRSGNVREIPIIIGKTHVQ